MRKSITVSITEPCHEDWNKMTPKDNGRHCSKCSKTVYDFTNHTDEQIVQHFEIKDNVCGRFKRQQLNRKIVFTRKGKNNYRNWIASTLFAFLSVGIQKSIAQTEPIKTTQSDTLKVPTVKGKVAQSILNKNKISGVVTAKSDGLPLPGVSIKIKGTQIETFTDFDGKYSIKTKKNDTLVFKYFTMKTKEVIINETTNINLKMEDDMCSTDFIVTGIVSTYEAKSACRKQKRREKRAKRKEERILSQKNKNRS